MELSIQITKFQITGASLTQPIPLSVSDCRGIVKTLVCGMKTITWGAGSCKIPGKVDFCKFDTRIAYKYDLVR